MQVKNTIGDIELFAPVVLYAILTWFWFYLNDSNSLPIIGHTELVRGAINSHADKTRLFFEMVYFALSVAIMTVATEVILSQVKLPFIKFDEGCGIFAATLVNFVVLVYEFFALEFYLRLIGLTLSLIFFFVVGMVIASKILEILRPLLKIADVAETISDITNTTDHDDKK